MCKCLNSGHYKTRPTINMSFSFELHAHSLSLLPASFHECCTQFHTAHILNPYKRSIFRVDNLININIFNKFDLGRELYTQRLSVYFRSFILQQFLCAIKQMRERRERSRTIECTEVGAPTHDFLFFKNTIRMFRLTTEKFIKY